MLTPEAMRARRRARIVGRWLLVLLGLTIGGTAILLLYGVYLVDAAMGSRAPAMPIAVGAPLVLERGAPWSISSLRDALLRRGVRLVQWRPGPSEVAIEGTRLVLGRGLCLQLSGEVTVETAEGRIELTTEGRPLAEVLVRGPVIGTRPTSDVVRWPVPLAEISPNFLTAVIDIEDRTFLQHAGLSLRGLVRAAVRDLLAGGVRQGGSTITQQLAKVLMLRPSRTLPRKVLEAWLATLLDFRYSKQEILEAYLNRIYLGQDGGWQIQGVAAAASFYFGKRPAELDIDEAALLAGLIAAPNRYDPFAHPEAATARRRVVLQAMVRERHLDPQAAEQLHTRALPTTPWRLRWPPAAHVLELVFEDAGRLQREVYSSLDLDMQWAVAEGAPAALARMEADSPRLQELARRGDPLQTAVAVVANDGRILALLGSRSGLPGEFNRATSARRPVGSLVKPFVAELALERGWTPASLLSDSPLQVLVGTETWEPHNSDGEYRGTESLAEALVHSHNVPMVRLGLAVGVPAVVERLRALGFAVAQPHPAILLGAFEATPLQVARAFAALNNQGRLPATLTWQLQKAVPADHVCEPKATASVLAVLEEVPRRGTAAALAGQVEGFLAAKTGTTDERRDSWFVALRQGYVMVVWVGTDGNAQTGLFGATGALEVWREIDRRLPRPRRLGWGGAK